MTSEEYSLAGYAGSISNSLFPLNTNKKFKRLFKNKDLKILLNCPYWLYAALVIIEKGTIRVEGIKNKPIEAIAKDKLKWNVYLDMDIVLYSRIVEKRKTLFDLAKDWLKGEIEFKGLLYVLDLIGFFNCLTKEKLEYEPPSD